MMTVNLTQNQKDISSAWNLITQDSKTERWALFGYDGTSNVIKLISSGSGGLKELVTEFHCSLIQYALCRIIDNSQGIKKLILINWQGESAPLTRKGLCASHVGDVSNYFKGCNQTITLRNEDEASVDYIMEQVLKCSSRITLSNANQIVRKSSHNLKSLHENSLPSDNQQAKEDITKKLANDRKTFWEEQEKEEIRRISEEKKRAAEKQAQYEKERKAYQEAEVRKLAKAARDREKIIDATRLADKQSQQSTRSSISAGVKEDEDDRVGRRSEILRLERSQETCTLIGKGSLKDKKAIFEQACAQNSANNVKTTNGTFNSSIRKSSSTLVSQRLNAFKSATENHVKNEDNGIQELGVVNHSSPKNVSESSKKEKTFEVNKEKVDAIKIVDDELDNHQCKTQEILLTSRKDVSDVNLNHNNNNINTETDDFQKPDIKNEISNGGHIHSTDIDAKSNQDHSSNETFPDNEAIIKSCGICAKALFDYQAGDDNEISFDPEDIIGHIEKVDKGWWHGRVLTGAFINQVGLFPSNYVEEL